MAERQKQMIVDTVDLEALGDKIRAKTGLTDKMTVKEMNTALDNVGGSGGSASVLTGYKGTEVPNNGTIEKVYFNTSLAKAEVKNLLNSSITWIDAANLGQSGFEFYPILAYMNGSNPYVLAMKKYTANVDVQSIGDINIAIINFANMLIIQNFFVDMNGGWDVFENPYPIGFEALSELSGIPIGTQNELIKSMFSTTPFEKETKTLSGEYDGSPITVTNQDVNMSELLDEGKLPKKIIVEDGLKKKVEGSNTCYYLMLDYKGKNVDFLENIDTSNVKTFSCMFSGNTYIETVPRLNTSNATNMNMMFYECQSLKTISEMETENVHDMSYMFYNCKNLVNVPKLNTKNANNMRAMFYWCESLQTILEMETENVTNMRDMLFCCEKLTDVSLNMNKITSSSSTQNMLGNCNKLTNLKLLNIRVTLQVGSGTSWGHMLTLDSLIGLCKECINTGSALTLTVGSANLDKIQNSGKFYKFVDSSVTEIAVDEKGEIEECDSTVTGSFSITDYMAMKNWTLA